MVGYYVISVSLQRQAKDTYIFLHKWMYNNGKANYSLRKANWLQQTVSAFTLWTGLLSLEEFRLLSNDAFQRFLMQQGVKKSQLVRNSRHTWLYQGKGAHQVLQDIKTRQVKPQIRCCCMEELDANTDWYEMKNQTLSFFLKGDSADPTPAHSGGPQWAAPGGPLRGGRALPRSPRQRAGLPWDRLHAHPPRRQHIHSLWDILQVRSTRRRHSPDIKIHVRIHCVWCGY